MLTQIFSNPEDVKPPPKGMMLGVMRAIAVLGGSADAFAIRDYIGNIMNSDIPTAQISVMLVRLEQRHMVSSQAAKQEHAPRRGRPRKVFSLTDDGKKALDLGLRILTASDNSNRGAQDYAARPALP